MNQLRRRQGAVVCGLLLGILLLAGCGSQANQSATAFDQLSTAPAGKDTASFGVTFEIPRAGLTLRQPDLQGAVLPLSNAPMRITFEWASEAHSQAQTQVLAQHHCDH